MRFGTFSGFLIVSRLRTPPAKATTITRCVLYLPGAFAAFFFGSSARRSPWGNASAPALAARLSFKKSRLSMGSVSFVFRARDERAQHRVARRAGIERLLE